MKLSEVTEVLDMKIRYYKTCTCRSCIDMCELVEEIKEILKIKFVKDEETAP